MRTSATCFFYYFSTSYHAKTCALPKCAKPNIRMYYILCHIKNVMGVSIEAGAFPGNLPLPDLPGDLPQ